MYLRGYEFDTFMGRAKHQLLSELTDKLNEGIEFGGQLIISEITPEEAFDQALGFQRFDGQYCLKGELTSREVITELILKHSRNVVLEAFIEAFIMEEEIV